MTRSTGHQPYPTQAQAEHLNTTLRRLHDRTDTPPDFPTTALIRAVSENA